MHLNERKDLVNNVLIPVLNSAFSELKERGWFAKGNYKCCSSCAGVTASKHENAVFWTKQDHEGMTENVTVWLKWHGDAQQIVETLRRHAVGTLVRVNWQGELHHAIKVYI
jgi:hypothetical protein